MREDYIQTRNFIRLKEAFVDLKELPASAPKMGLGYGNYGLGKTMSLNKIADIIAINKNLSFENKIDKSNFQKSVLLALNTCLSNNLVEKVSKEGLSIVWKIKEI